MVSIYFLDEEANQLIRFVNIEMVDLQTDGEV